MLFRSEWLMMHGFGIEQREAKYAKEWIFDWLRSGYLAEMAMEGYIEGQQLGVLNIKKIISE